MATVPQKVDQHDKDFSAFQSPHEASIDRLVVAVDRAYHRPFLMMWRAFLYGMMTAIGAAVGTALVIILTGYVFKALNGPQLVKGFVENVTQSVQTQNKAVNNLLENNTSQ